MDRALKLGAGKCWALGVALALVAPSAHTAYAQQAVKRAPQPQSLLPQPLMPPKPAPTPTTSPTPQASPSISAGPLVTPVGPQPIVEPVMNWQVSDASALLNAIEAIDAEGLIPDDYQPEALRVAILAGPGAALDAQASRSFDWLVEDLRDGRSPWKARVQWFAVDPDQDTMPTAQLLTEAVSQHDVPDILARLDPTYPDFAALKQALSETDPTDVKRRQIIRLNMDRWRWLPRDLGEVYLYVNVPEFQVRLMRGDHAVRTYRGIVGKPGPTATPQLAQQVKAVVFNPTWTLPQSIIEHDHLTAARGRAKGYKVTVAEDGTMTMVQPPGDSNSLGRMKIDMPNPHAIYLHDTPNKSLFNASSRAFSHGCIRTERAVELGMTMAMLGANMTVDQAVALSTTIKYTRVPMVKTFPVYIAYFTAGRDVDGQLVRFADIYGRDAPIAASFAEPRVPHTTQRRSEEKVIEAQDAL